ncbi:aquaglyceroporin like protein, other eukaryote [Capronia coronata CBS 617.96]|uniref:Aquaglyceroporin like protein, other eukaryote n=1 Tax=Capronia coronata CBS 617.96 TaxID=1182541 RepID=W9XT62_9EURO|nr:aquaglyceroporin like protein, other eukaryote [Capronia coronata CBS 617.96]EXJ80525.1 aquaglyceroporin like protein, other eukaryote [Capronia coronata CBS 617.96]
MDPYDKPSHLHADHIAPRHRGPESSSSHPGSDEVTVTHHEHEPDYELDDIHAHIDEPVRKRTANMPNASSTPGTAPTISGPQQQPSMDPDPRSPHPFHAEHGPPIDNVLKYDDAEEDYQHIKSLWWSRVRHELRDPFAEFLGSFIMILFGDGSAAQVTLSASTNLPASSRNKGDWQSIAWGWGVGVMLGVYVAGCSGGHLNPTVTFCNCLYRKFPWYKFPLYFVAQTLGCLCAAAVIYGNYKSAIDVYEGGSGIRTVPGYSDTATAGIFCTYPQPFLTKTGQAFSEIIASAVLVLVIFALKDDTNLGAGNLVPLCLCFLIYGIGATLGWETAYAINMARDFGPRLFTYMVGYGPHVWTAGDYYFWVPMVCPFVGGTFGAFLYDTLIYTGESPINTPWMGVKRVVRPSRKRFVDAITGRTDRQV